MAIYDRRHHKIVVRVVYDGAACSGKTTNAQQICASFTTRKRGDLVVPEESGGRTQYFDWLQLDTGLVGGYPMRCQIVTVPGQQSLRHRRARLLESADVVVFVVDSTTDGLLDASRAHTELIEAIARVAHLTDRDPVPVIVQANKQDLPDALMPDQVQATLGLPEDTVIAPAAAGTGAGVRETLVLAIRAAADRVQRGLLAHGIDAIDGVCQEVDELLAAMKAAEALLRDPVVASRSEQVRALMRWRPDPLDYDSNAREAALESAAVAEWEASAQIVSVTEPEPIEPAAEPEPEPEPGAPKREINVSATDTGWELDTNADETTTDTATTTEVDATTVTATATDTDTAADTDTVSVPGVEPAFPDPLVPTGFIWPGTTGRVLLQDLTGKSFTPRHDLVGQHGGVDGSGASDMLIYEAGPWFLKTSLRRRFADVDTARTALLQTARKKVSLGEMLLPHTVLSLRPDARGGIWLWTVAPLVSTLRHDMLAADNAGDARALGEALSQFANAAVDAMVMAQRDNIVLDVHPGNFAHADDRIAYIDDDIDSGSALPLIGALLLARVQEYEHHPAAVERYVSELEYQIFQRLSPDEMRGLDLLGELRDAPARSGVVRDARARLERSVKQTLDRSP